MSVSLSPTGTHFALFDGLVEAQFLSQPVLGATHGLAQQGALLPLCQ